MYFYINICNTTTPKMKAMDSRITFMKECDFFKSPRIVFNDRYKKAPEEKANS